LCAASEVSYKFHPVLLRDETPRTDRHPPDSSLPPSDRVVAFIHISRSGPWALIILSDPLTSIVDRILFQETIQCDPLNFLREGPFSICLIFTENRSVRDPLNFPFAEFSKNL
jgi:hypothetical protein